MPRTKKHVRSSKVRSKTSTVKTKQEREDSMASSEDVVQIWISNFEEDFATTLLNWDNKITLIKEQVHQIAFEEFTLLSTLDAKKTLRELRTEKSFDTTAMKSLMFGTASLLKHLNCTTNTTLANSKKKKHSDEGYLTAGDSGNLNGDSDHTTQTQRPTRLRSSSVSRQGRPPTKQIASKRRSRSVSRMKGVTINASDKVTPDRALKPPLYFGMVTPKVKPNMPVSILRHPKQGEMAISMAGSPLLVSSVITEEYANVNIPLQDGRVISMQPNRGLRMSEIPPLDEETRQQLLALRDNLNKVVKLAFED